MAAQGRSAGGSADVKFVHVDRVVGLKNALLAAQMDVPSAQPASSATPQAVPKQTASTKFIEWQLLPYTIFPDSYGYDFYRFHDIAFMIKRRWR